MLGLDMVLPEPWSTLGDKYFIIRVLGHGSFGAVLEAQDMSCPASHTVAIKLFPRGQQSVTRYVEDEFVNHRNVSFHPHVISFKEAFCTPEYLCLVMEFAVGGTLLNYVRENGNLEEDVARRFFQQLILGVDFCHRKGVALRDIKLENLLLQDDGRMQPSSADSWLLKLCDFGYSRSESQSAPITTVGTLVYMAPEVIRARNQAEYSGPVADLWSAGIVLYILLARSYPFALRQDALHELSQAEVVGMVRQMMNRQIHLPSSIAVSPQCRHLLQALLEPVPEERITIPHIYQHPWFCVDLPPTFQVYNDRLLLSEPRQAGDKQTEEQIRGIVREAAARPLMHDDEMIAAEIRAMHNSACWR